MDALLPERPRSSSPRIKDEVSENYYDASSVSCSSPPSSSSIATRDDWDEKIQETQFPKVLFLRRLVAPAHTKYPSNSILSDNTPPSEVSLSSRTASLVSSHERHEPPSGTQDPSNPNDFQWTMDHCMNLEEEEPFSLDSYHRLLKNHLLLGKDLILARVQTSQARSGNDGPIFHSYYAAHPLNKLLFRTQIERGLIHRVQARNPLNNMIIRGSVEYYTILASEARALEVGTPHSTDGVNGVPGRASSCSPSLVPMETPLDGSSPIAVPARSIPSRPASAQGRMEMIRRIVEDKGRGRENLPDPGWWTSAPSPTSSFQDFPVYRAYYIGNDANFLQHPQMRIYFWHHAMKPDDARLFPLYSGDEMSRLRFPRMPRRPLLLFPNSGVRSLPPLPVGISGEEGRTIERQRAQWEIDERRRLSRQAGRNCVRWLILSYILTVFVLLLFYMPTHFAGGLGIILGSLVFILLASYLSFARAPLSCLRRRSRREEPV